MTSPTLRFVPAVLTAAVLATSPAIAQSGPLPDPGQRVILVTGSTSGLGREVARSLAADGDHVILHGRNEDRGRALLDEINGAGVGSARFYRADFASLEQVRRLASSILRDYDRLDVLVNNAGVVMPELRMTEDGNEFTFQVNYLAHYLLTEELLPLIRASAPARIVQVSSLAATPFDWDDPQALDQPYDGGAAYGRSKHAQVMHTLDLAAELEGSGVLVNALHPETFMDTNMVQSMGLEPRSSVLTGRDNVLQLINDDVGTGEYYVDGKPVPAPSPQAYEPEARARLEVLSDDLIEGHRN